MASHENDACSTQSNISTVSNGSCSSVIHSSDAGSSSSSSRSSSHLPLRPIGKSIECIGLMDLFGVQLEVTSRLLYAEQRKLRILEREHTIASQSSYRHLEAEQLKSRICHIQQQHDQLQREYEQAATAVLKKSSKLCRASRSQPAIGLKQANKSRPSIFGTVTSEVSADTGYNKPSRRSVCYPQRSLVEVISDMSGGGGGDVKYHGVVANGFHNGTDVVDGEEDALVYQDGELVSGSMDALIQHLVPTKQYYPDRTYIFAFLLSSRLFQQPYQVLQRVCQTCMYQQNLVAETATKDTLGRFAPHMIRLLGEWSDNFPYDFRDERMMHSLKDMTQRLVAINPELRKDVGILMHNLFAKLSSLQKYEDLLSKINAEIAQRLINIMPNTDIYEVCPNPLVLAQQLTHIELERLSMIGPEEFVQAFAKESEVKQKYKDTKKTNNLESYVQWFNRLSYFVATEICMHLKKKNRCRMIEYFIDVAKECINIGNFNSLMAIIAGLSMSSIQRLKKTWGKVNTEKFDVLEHQMNPAGNFTSYRASLKAALWRSEGAIDDREKIVIPFFSLFVKDMYFLNEGCSNKLDTGHLNFDKFWKLAKQVTEFLSWKQVECPFDRHPPVLNYILTNPVFSENSLALASFECETPENQFERDRYKNLKEQAGLS